MSLRGFNQRLSNKVLVLVDGRSVYVDLLGATLWSTLSIGVEDVERIEVVRGPGSVLYGTGARVSEVVGLNLGDIADALEKEFASDFDGIDPQHRAKLETLNGIHSNAAGLRRWLETTKGDPDSVHPHSH